MQDLQNFDANRIFIEFIIIIPCFILVVNGIKLLGLLFGRKEFIL